MREQEVALSTSLDILFVDEEFLIVSKETRGSTMI